MDYELVLKNEVEITAKNLNAVFKTNEVFVAGYGSLLYSSGWRGRNMKIAPKKKDLRECSITGYERGPYGIYCPVSQGYSLGMHFYGVIENNKARTNVVLAKIHSLRDWVNLMATEFIAGMTKVEDCTYHVVDVTDNICDIKLKKNQRIHMVVNEAINKETWKHHSPAPRYYTDVAKGVKKERTLDFQRNFFKTGGLTTKQAAQCYKTSKINKVI